MKIPQAMLSTTEKRKTGEPEEYSRSVRVDCSFDVSHFLDAGVTPLASDQDHVLLVWMRKLDPFVFVGEASFCPPPIQPLADDVKHSYHPALNMIQ